MHVGYRESWIDLAAAVVLQAVEDYRASLRKLKRFPRKKKFQQGVKNCEEFFHEGDYRKYYEAVLGVEGRMIVERIRKEVERGRR